MIEHIHESVRPVVQNADTPARDTCALTQVAPLVAGDRRGELLIHHTAIIGSAPEHRDWTTADPVFPPIVAPTARIAAYVTIDAGTQRRTLIGDHAWLMKHVHVGHDAQIGHDCELSPGTVIGGHATIGDHVKIGMNATINPFVAVGDGARVGSGAVVVRDVQPGTCVAGNPAREIAWPDLPKAVSR